MLDLRHQRCSTWYLYLYLWARYVCLYVRVRVLVTMCILVKMPCNLLVILVLLLALVLVAGVKLKWIDNDRQHATKDSLHKQMLVTQFSLWYPVLLLSAVSCFAGWQVILCDTIWHVSSRSGETFARIAIHDFIFTFTLSCYAVCDILRFGLSWTDKRTDAPVDHTWRQHIPR